MNTIRIAIPIQAPTVAAMLHTAASVPEEVYAVEYRTDSLKNPTPAALSELKQHTSRTAILTCRSSEEGGQFQGTTDERCAILQEALNLGFPYVDIEHETLKSHAFEHDGSTRIIRSFHCFSHAPSYKDLVTLHSEMRTLGADIVKIAVTPQRETDISVLFRIMTEVTHPTIIIGMGSRGAITRLLGPMLGGYLTFASWNENKSAPGQPSYHELQAAYHSINQFISR